MSANVVDNDDLILVIRPWIVPSLVEETVMAVVVFGVSYLAELYFGSLYTPLFGSNLVILTGLGLVLIWVINAVHLLLTYSMTRYTLRRGSLEIRSGILKRSIVEVTLVDFSDVVVMQSIMGKIMGEGELFVRFHGDHIREGKMMRVRNPFIVESEIRKIMAK
jgi:uncharacterized membrane protein YdbT with pleckstrin-like domain